MPEKKKAKYINREYGFTFRPPFFDKFYEESLKGPAVTEQNYPNRYIIGVGYDYSAINGAMFIGPRGTLWGVKVSYYNGKKWLDNEDFIQNMGIGCANTPDGSFAHFSSGPLSVKWAKHNEQALAIEISSRKRLRVRVIFYPAYKWVGDLSIEGAFVKGRSPYVGIIPGDISFTDTNAVFKERYQVVMDESEGREYFMAQSYNKPSDSANGAFNEAIMEFTISKNQPRIHLYAAIGDEQVLVGDVPRLDRIVKMIESAELRYGVNKTVGTGALGKSVENMLNSIMWSKIYYPYLIDTIYSPARSSLDNHFNIGGIEENCAALLGCYVRDDLRSAKQLRYTCEDKVMAMLSMLHIFMHSRDREPFRELYKTLIKQYPPDDLELVTTKDHTKNEVAYKWTDSPLKETYINQTMYSLDLSCLKLFAFDVLERFAVYFEMPEAKKYGKAKEEYAKKINETLWNDDKGLYMNRYLTGTWALNYGATSFYPLIAGAADTTDKLSRMMNTLTDPRRFWGDNIIPTLSKDNRDYGKRGAVNAYGKKDPPYLEYRGSIVPYVNYFIYHGLVRYGFDQIAGELAGRSVKLWQQNDSANVENYSLYLPSGKRVKNPKYLSNIGNMLALMGVQELIDIDYFRSDLKNTLRFGTFAKGNHSVTNLLIYDKNYSIEVNEGTTILLVNNMTLFKSEGGRCKVRQFFENINGCEFLIDAQNELSVNVFLYKAERVSQSDYAIHFTVPQGKSKVVIENRNASVMRIF